MVNIERIQVISTGYPGGPGVTTFYALDADAIMDALKVFMGGFAGYQPNTVTYSFPVAGDTIDPATGTLVGSWTAHPVDPAVGGGTGPYAAPSGAYVNWFTDAVLDGRRLKGRTFFVPLEGSHYQSDGTLDATTLADLQSGTDTFQSAAASNFIVWHRPRAVSVRHPTARAGGYQMVTSGKVPDKVCVLRSRRD